MANSTPDSIYYPVGTDSVTPLHTIFANLASSVQNALNKRQRFGYVWANATARAAQTGMSAGATGYQIDTKTEYLYDGTNWATQNVTKLPTVIPVSENGAQPAIGSNPLIKQIDSVTLATNASGLAAVSLPNGGFPNGLLHVSVMTLSGTGTAPVINSGQFSKTRFVLAYPGTPNTTIRISYEATGY